MSKPLFYVACLAITFLGSTNAIGQCTEACCPKCSTPCVLKVSPGTETRYCWKLESKTVCIPRVRFSWQWPWEKKEPCRDPSCDGHCGTCCPPPLKGRSRQICVLVKHEYECPKCKYSWEPVSADDCCASGGEETEPTLAATVPGLSIPTPKVVR